VKTLDEILGQLRREKPELQRRFGVRRLAVFGSYARGEQRADSDVDILVEVDPSIGLRFVDLAEHLQALLGLPSEVVSSRALGARSLSLIQPDLRDVA
jgi:uncharacterized protein